MERGTKVRVANQGLVGVDEVDRVDQVDLSPCRPLSTSSTPTSYMLSSSFTLTSCGQAAERALHINREAAQFAVYRLHSRSRKPPGGYPAEDCRRVPRVRSRAG